jgi:hypothetical protein
MASSRADLEAAIELRQCAEARTLGRRRARSVAAVFGRNNLTRHARKQIDEALRAAGIETTPAILDCDRDDWLSLEVVGEPPLSDDLPSQIVTWHEFNWTGEGDDGPNGEWLRCLKDTLSHQRQFVWSGFKVAGLVTFSGWVRPGDGFFEGWGSLTRLRKPVDRVALRMDERTAPRFDGRGIRALQGSPITVEPELARALCEMTRGIGATPVPLDEPDYNEEPILWTGLHGLRPEAYIEAAVATRPELWRKLGFPSAPARQRGLGAAGRVDLIAGDVVGEAKRAVTLRDGPDQVERYLTYLELQRHRPRSRLRGVLLQCSPEVNAAVAARVGASQYRLELWSVVNDGRWRLERLA